MKSIKEKASTKYAMNDIDNITNDNKIILVSKEILPECEVVFVTKKSIKTTW